jgi:hypothetical protein
MNQKQTGIFLSVIILIASMVGIAMAVNNLMVKQHAVEDSNREVALAQKDYNDAVAEYNSYVQSH